MSFCVFVYYYPTQEAEDLCSSSPPFSPSADFMVGCANDSLTATYWSGEDSLEYHNGSVTFIEVLRHLLGRKCLFLRSCVDQIIRCLLYL